MAFPWNITTDWLTDRRRHPRSRETAPRTSKSPLPLTVTTQHVVQGDSNNNCIKCPIQGKWPNKNNRVLYFRSVSGSSFPLSGTTSSQMAWPRPEWKSYFPNYSDGGETFFSRVVHWCECQIWFGWKNWIINLDRPRGKASKNNSYNAESMKTSASTMLPYPFLADVSDSAEWKRLMEGTLILIFVLNSWKYWWMDDGWETHLSMGCSMARELYEVVSSRPTIELAWTDFCKQTNLSSFGHFWTFD